MAASENLKNSLSAAFGAAGYQKEKYTVEPAGFLAFSVAVTPGIYGYAAASFFSKIEKLGLFVGFGYSELKIQTDRCFMALSAQKQLPEMHSVAIPCPAALFPAELYVGRPRGDAISTEKTDYLNESVGVVNDCILRGRGASVRSIESLRDFLLGDGDPLLGPYLQRQTEWFRLHICFKNWSEIRRGLANISPDERAYAGVS